MKWIGKHMLCFHLGVCSTELGAISDQGRNNELTPGFMVQSAIRCTHYTSYGILIPIRCYEKHNRAGILATKHLFSHTAVGGTCQCWKNMMCKSRWMVGMKYLLPYTTVGGSYQKWCARVGPTAARRFQATANFSANKYFTWVWRAPSEGKAVDAQTDTTSRFDEN